MNQKTIYHANVNVYLMGKNVVQIHGGITINASVRVKNVMYVKRLYLESCYI